MSAEGTDVIFEGCNVHVRNGLGYTRRAPYGSEPQVNQLGNLIIGYNEYLPPRLENPDGYFTRYRTASHKLVIGPAHSYTSYGSLLARVRNDIMGEFASVSGGYQRTAPDLYAWAAGTYFADE